MRAAARWSLVEVVLDIVNTPHHYWITHGRASNHVCRLCRSGNGTWAYLSICHVLERFAIARGMCCPRPDYPEVPGFGEVGWAEPEPGDLEVWGPRGVRPQLLIIMVGAVGWRKEYWAGFSHLDVVLISNYGSLSWDFQVALFQGLWWGWLPRLLIIWGKRTWCPSRGSSRSHAAPWGGESEMNVDCDNHLVRVLRHACIILSHRHGFDAWSHHPVSRLWDVLKDLQDEPGAVGCGCAFGLTRSDRHSCFTNDPLLLEHWWLLRCTQPLLHADDSSRHHLKYVVLLREAWRVLYDYFSQQVGFEYEDPLRFPWLRRQWVPPPNDVPWHTNLLTKRGATFLPALVIYMRRCLHSVWPDTPVTVSNLAYENLQLSSLKLAWSEALN